MIRLAMIAALPLLVAGAAPGPDWWQIGVNDGFAMYVDKSRVADLPRDRVSAWTLTLSEEAFEGVIGAHFRNEIDCKARTITVLEATFVDEERNEAGSEVPDAPETDAIAPNSLNDQLADFVCDKKGGTQVTDPYADAKAMFAANEN